MDSLQFTRFERREHRVAVMVRPDRDLPDVQADPGADDAGRRQSAFQCHPGCLSPRCEFPKILISTYVNDDDMAEIASPTTAPESRRPTCRGFSTGSSPRNRAVWDWVFPSVGRSSNRTAGSSPAIRSRVNRPSFGSRSLRRQRRSNGPRKGTAARARSEPRRTKSCAGGNWSTRAIPKRTRDKNDTGRSGCTQRSGRPSCRSTFSAAR